MKVTSENSFSINYSGTNTVLVFISLVECLDGQIYKKLKILGIWGLGDRTQLLQSSWKYSFSAADYQLFFCDTKYLYEPGPSVT